MEELKNISIRGRMAYLISSFENVLLHYNCNKEEWRWLLEKLWSYTKIQYIDDWMYELAEYMCCSLCKLLQYEYYKSGSHCIRNLCDGYCYVLHQPEKLYARQGVWYSEI